MHDNVANRGSGMSVSCHTCLCRVSRAVYTCMLSWLQPASSIHFEDCKASLLIRQKSLNYY